MMLNSNTDTEYTKSAYGASSDSGSSEEQRKPRKREHKKPKKAKARENKKKEKDKDDKPKKKKNTCPHCKKYHRKKPHCVEPDKCMWNKKYKGYCFKLICDELEVDFKPRIKFLAELGGYAEKKDSDSE
jgi:hypothetical protein